MLDQTEAAAIQSSDLAVAVFDLATRRVLAVSPAMGGLLRGDAESLVGRVVTDLVADEPADALPLLASGRLDAIEAARRLRLLDGTVLDAYLWVHVLGDERPARRAVVVAAAGGGAPVLASGPSHADAQVIGTIDAEWRVDRVSTEVQTILGCSGATASRTPVLTAVHPNDLADLLSGLAHVHGTERDAVVRIRLRHHDGRWLWVRARLASIGNPPCFAFSLHPIREQPHLTEDRTRDLEHRLLRIASEVRAAGPGLVLSGAPPLTELPQLADLTSREWEVLSRLRHGARVSTIAEDLQVTPSTVRNYLSSVFRKVGVRSQAELLDTLHAASG